MAWKDLKAGLSSLFAGRGEKTSHRPDGGTSCYRPVQRKNRQEEQLAQQKAAEYAAGQPQVAYAHSGFTGMNPPTGGSAPVQSTITQDPYGYGAAQAAIQNSRSGQFRNAGAEGYAAPAAQPGMQGGYAAPAAQQGYQGGYAAPAAQPEYQGGYAAPAAKPEYRGSFPNSAQQPAASNISYMPGVYAPEAGSSYTHVEHIMAITSLQSCYEAIECMKNGETLIVTLDVLGSESESIRCQDMLAGAAFTLQCTVRTLAGPGVVVIAPPGVKMLPEQKMRRYEVPAAEAAAQPYPAEENRPRRERRTSQNAYGWDNTAQPGTAGFNPYTGGMPVAAGAYSAYGGY